MKGALPRSHAEDLPCFDHVSQRAAVPLLSNSYLDALDQELEKRGHSYRFLEDCNIYVSSQAAAERTLTSIRGWIEKHLRL